MRIIFEGTRYDKQASKIISDSGLFSPEISDKIIEALFKEDIHAFVHSPNWLEKYLKGIARMLVEESNGSQQNAQSFLEECPEVFDQFLTYVKENRDKLGGSTFDTKFNTQMSYEDVKKFNEDVRAELDKQSKDELSKMNFGSSSYELIPIDSFDQFNKLFGGHYTGDGESDEYAGGGGTAWCHANSKSTYNQWVKGHRKFFVLARNNWKDIPFNSESNRNNPKDDYGNSLIAIRVGPSGNLLNATLRCNHVGVPSNADNQYKTYSELSKIAGFNVEDEVMKNLPDRSGDVYTWNGIYDVPEDVVNVVIEDGVEEIRGHEFYNCESLTSIKIPNSVIKIGFAAFSGCHSLTSVEIPDSVTEIGYKVFSFCSSLKSVNIPNSVTEIEPYVFNGCTSLKSITIPGSVKVIKDGAFEGCTSLESITIPDSVTGIGPFAFKKCTSLESITIPDGVTYIGKDAFEHCDSLKSVTIPDSVTEIAHGAFSHCRALRTVNMPDSITEIGWDAFYNCRSLNTFDITDNVTKIGSEAFEGTSIKFVTIPSDCEYRDSSFPDDCEVIRR